MSSEKINETNELFRKQLENSMKMFQESAASVAQAYGKQAELVSNLYSRALETSLGLNKGGVSNTSEVAEKMNELMHKSMENFSRLSKTSMDTILEYGKQNGNVSFSKEKMNAIVKNYTEQAEGISQMNKKYLESVNKQFGTVKESISPLLARVKDEVEHNFKTSKESISTLSESFGKSFEESAESSKEFMTELNARMNTMITNNMKIWSDLFSAIETKETESVKHPVKTAATTATTEAKNGTTEAHKKTGAHK
ncbi:MAG: hypothetical protein ACHQRM_10530 [Bacteroidia bacterium]